MPDEPKRKRGGGPRTPEGKARSSLNALKHGLSARKVVLENESQKEFNALLAGLTEAWQTVDTMEAAIVADMAAARWRLQRIWSRRSHRHRPRDDRPGRRRCRQVRIRRRRNPYRPCYEGPLLQHRRIRAHQSLRVPPSPRLRPCHLQPPPAKWLAYLGAWPSRKSVQRLREKVYALLRPSNLGTWKEVRDQLNVLLKGWRSYFSYGTLFRVYRAADAYVYQRVRAFLRRRHKTNNSRATSQYSDAVVYGKLGVFRFQGDRPGATA